MKKFRGVIIGAGYFSNFHADAWSRIKEIEMSAVCDINVHKAGLLANQFGLNKIYSNFEEMFDLEKPDFVDIVTQPNTHLNIIKSAVSRGIHIICQKPLAETIEEALEIRNIIENSGIRFMVHENWRFQPWYREIKSLLQSGIIGKKILQYNFRMRTGDGWGDDAYKARQPYFRSMPRLLIHETGVHFVDTFRYLEGEIAEVYANLKTFNPKIIGEDAATVFFRFESGCTALFDANRYNESFHENNRYTFGEMWVEGDEGSLKLNHNGTISIKPLGKPVKETSFDPSKQGFSGDSVYHCQRHFINGIERNTPFETRLDEYLKTLQVVEAIYQSHLEERKISLKNLDLIQL